MATYDSELKYFEMKLSDNFKKIFNHNRSRTHSSHQNKIKRLRSQAQNEIVLGTEYLNLNNQPEPHYNEVNMHGAGNILPSSADDYPDMELNKYFNFDANVGASPSKQDFETRRIQSLDDFFQDFNEIISSEMKTTTTPYDQGRHSAVTNNSSYGDQSNGFSSNVSGADFNLDLTQFYINTNESDFLNSDDLKTDFSHGMIHFPTSQFGDKTVDDHFSVIDLSNAGTRMHSNASYIPNSHAAIVADQPEFSVIDHTDQSERMADYSDNTKISVSTPLDQFYLDFKVNGGDDSVTNGDKSVVTYIKDSLQSVEYINESGQTETVMYVDQQSVGIHDETNGSGITQYEIIDLNDYPYQAENGESQQHNSNDNEVNVSNSNPVQYNDENADIGQQTDILSTLFSDRNNKITMIARPLKHPKFKRPNDEFYLKFEAIDNNPTNIAFAKQSKARGCRKQKLETINQIEVEVIETKRGRPKLNKTVATAVATTTTTTKTASMITETPKLPSKFMKDRRSKTQTRRKRPRKLCWDSESDYEHGEKFSNIA